MAALTQYSRNLWNLASRLFRLTVDGGTNTIQSESVELGIQAVSAHFVRYTRILVCTRCNFTVLTCLGTSVILLLLDLTFITLFDNL